MLFSLKFKKVLTATVIATLTLLSIVATSQAFEIEKVGPAWGYYEETDWGSGAYHHAYVRTSEPFYDIVWYVNDSYAGWSDGGHRTNETYKFDLPTLAGSLTGETHKITAVAYLLHANGDVESDSQSYTVKVYKPKIDSGTRLHDVDGYAELSRHYYSHPYIHVEGYVSAYHPGTINLDRYGFYRFRHKVKGPGVDFSEFEEPEGLTRFQENEPYGPYSTTSKLSCDISAGSTGDRYTADVYLKAANQR